MTNKTYTVDEAKNKFEQLIDKADSQPITITKNNQNVAVILSIKDIDTLSFLLEDFFIEQVKTGEMTLMQALFNQAIVCRDVKQAEKDVEQERCTDLSDIKKTLI